MYDVENEKEIEHSERISERDRKTLKSYPTPIFLLLIWSIILSAFSVLNPFLAHLSTNVQSQNLYAAWVIPQGQVPYYHFYANSGLLFYFISWLGSLVFGSVLLLLFQAILFYLSGVFLCKTLNQLEIKTNVIGNILHLFYLLVFLIGFGGFYSILFAFPLIFWSMNFLVRYLKGDINDGLFVAFGMFAALSFMIEPLFSVVFYILTTLMLFVYNIISKHIARGLYQFLASLLGFSLIFYPLGYYAVWNATFDRAINQVTYAISAFNLTGSHWLSNLLYYGLLFIGLGFGTAVIANFSSKEKNMVTPILRFISFFGVLTSFVLAIALPEQGSYQLLPMLPYIIILLALWFNKGEGKSAGRHRRNRREISIWSRYLTGQFFLPIIAMVYLIGYPLVQEYILSNGVSSERNQAAQYIQKNSTEKEKIYAWDTTSSLYKESNRLSAVPLLSPTLYKGTKENQIRLQDNLATAKPKFILVNNQVSVSSEVKQKLSSDYQETDLKLTHFKLYQLK